MSKYDVKTHKKGSSVWMLRYEPIFRRNKATDIFYKKTSTIIEKVKIHAVIRASVNLRTRRRVVGYMVTNGEGQLIHAEPHQLFTRRNSAIESMYSEVKSILGDRLQQFVNKNKIG